MRLKYLQFVAETKNQTAVFNILWFVRSSKNFYFTVFLGVEMCHFHPFRYETLCLDI